MNTINAAPQEFTPPPETALAGIQAGREFNAQQVAEGELRACFDPETVLNRSFTVNYVERNGLPADQAMLNAGLLLSLDALGANAKNIAMTTGREEDHDAAPIYSLALGDDTLDIRRHADGLSFKLTADKASDLNDYERSDAVSNLMKARLLRSPAHRALVEAGEQLALEPTTPESFSTAPFNYTEDPLGSALFFNDIGLTTDSYGVAQMLKQGATLQDVLHESFNRIPPYRAAKSQNDTNTVYTWGENIQKQVEFAPDGTCVLTVSQHPVTAYLELANQGPTMRSLPFVETVTAHELSDSLDQAGLMFHPQLQLEMMNIKEADRYGSVYTQISREIAKWVDDPRRTRLSNLFVPANDQYSGVNLAKRDKHAAIYEYEAEQYDVKEETEAAVRQAYASMNRDAETNEPTAVIFDMIDDVLARDSDPSLAQNTDLPVTKETVHITNGACFDVVAYYVGAAAESYLRPHYLQNISIGNVQLLEKSTGNHTFMTTNPQRFNGIRLPKGALFSQADDGNWAFLRLTPFAFDAASDQLAFGSEITKMLANEKAAVARIGEVGMQTLVQYATKTNYS